MKKSAQRIEKAFAELVQKKSVTQITITEICKKIKINRSTFYANYQDINELADRFRDKLEQQVGYKNMKNEKSDGGIDYLILLNHIKNNQLLYKTYFKLGFDDYKIIDYDEILAEMKNKGNDIAYHIAFFKAGFNEIIKIWLANDCTETPEYINGIIESEYSKRK